MGRSVVGGRYRGDNRQPQPGPLRATARLSPAEPVKGVGEKTVWKTRALILDVQLDCVVRPSCAKRDRSLPVTQRVVNHVGQSPLEPGSVRPQLQAVARRYQDLASVAAALDGTSRLHGSE